MSVNGRAPGRGSGPGPGSGPRDERQAAFCEKIAYPPVSVKGMELVSEKVKKDWIPDPKNPRNLAINDDWWGEPGRFAELTARFKTWLLT